MAAAVAAAEDAGGNKVGLDDDPDDRGQRKGEGTAAGPVLEVK